MSLAGLLVASPDTLHLTPDTIFAEELPSLFRGLAVADSPMGVRVVSVEESSQAYQADLRPEDLVVRIHGQTIQTIDDFAALSSAIKGRVIDTTVVVFRHGRPRALQLHLYSYPILEAWGIQFLPEQDVRFAQPKTGLAYWSRMGRGFEEAGKPIQALGAYLNGLHNVASDFPTAVKVSELLWEVGRVHLESGRLAQGLQALEQAVTLLEHLFDHPLTEAQLQTVRTHLQQTLEGLREARRRLTE